MPDRYATALRKQQQLRCTSFERVAGVQHSRHPDIASCCVEPTTANRLRFEMRLHVRSFRRLVTLALPCWLVGGPLAGTLQSVAACPHHDTMPSPMEHDAGSRAPCWCPNMSGAALV